MGISEFSDNYSTNSNLFFDSESDKGNENIKNSKKVKGKMKIENKKKKRNSKEYLKVVTMDNGNEEMISISNASNVTNYPNSESKKGKGKKVIKERYIKDKESVNSKVKDDNTKNLEMIPLHETLNPIDESSGFKRVSHKQALKNLNVYRKKWLVRPNVKDPIEKIMRLVYKNYDINEENITMEIVKRCTLQELFNVGSLLAHFRLNNQLKERDEESGLTYEHIINKIFEILYYSEKVVKYQYRMKMVLDPDYDYSMNDNIDAIDRFRAVEADKNTPFQNMLLMLLSELFEKRYRRFNGSCYKQIFNEDGYFTYSWKEAKTIEEFVYEFSSSTNYANFHNATSSRGNIQEAIKFLTTCSEPQFPVLKKNRHVFSFRNGVYIAKYKEKGSDVVKDMFYKYGTKPPLPSSYVACKYFDLEFNNHDDIEDWYDIPTPNFQKIIDYQFKSHKDYELICKWMYILIGKLMYELKECDRWQIMPYLIGVAGSGKSKIAEVISAIYESIDVATIENTTEKQFGLAPHKDKYIIILSEIKKDFNIDQAIFQKMISGEDLTLSEKYKAPKKVRWSLPGFICANEFPNFGDAQGSISRRFIIFSFDKQVNPDDCDPDLENKLKLEMGAIIKKCNRAYLDIINSDGKKDIWKLLPEYFYDNRDTLSNETNPLKHFLSSARIEYGKDKMIKEVDFKREFFEYCRENNLQKPRWNDNVYKEPFMVFSYKKKVDIAIKKGVRNTETNRILTTPSIVGLTVVSNQMGEDECLETEKQIEL